MAVPYVMPRVFGTPGKDSPDLANYLKAQNAAFKAGDFLALVTTGTIVNPNPNGSIAAAPGPIMPNVIGSPVTITNVATAGAVAQTYYIILTYVGAAAIESQPSQEYLFSSPAGYTPSVVVTSVGAPVGATGTAEYVGLLPGSEAQQAASTNFTVTFTLPATLANYQGVNQATTNQAANIVGLALHGSDAVWATGVGGSSTAGANRNLLGVTANPPPIGDPGNFGVVVVKLRQSQPLVMSLVQPFYNNITAVGLLLDTVSGKFVLDTTQSNKIFTITSALDMIDTSNSSGGVNIPGVGVAGRQVLGFFNAGVI
jgi:hypothetical protein